MAKPGQDSLFNMDARSWQPEAQAKEGTWQPETQAKDPGSLKRKRRILAA